MCRVAAGREKDRAKSGCGLLELEQSQSERFPVVSYFTSIGYKLACITVSFSFLGRESRESESGHRGPLLRQQPSLSSAE